MRFDVRADLREVQRMQREYKTNVVPNAAARAINKTLGNVRTESSKQIRIERALSAKVVRDALAVQRASKVRLHGAVIASGRPIPLREYQARQTRQGVTVKVSPGGRKLVVHSGNKAFEINRYGKHVYARVGGKRLPIKKLYGPSIPATFLKQKVMAAMDRVAGDNWPKRFAEELRHELARQG